MSPPTLPLSGIQTALLLLSLVVQLISKTSLTIYNAFSVAQVLPLTSSLVNPELSIFREGGGQFMSPSRYLISWRGTSLAQKGNKHSWTSHARQMTHQIKCASRQLPIFHVFKINVLFV